MHANATNASPDLLCNPHSSVPLADRSTPAPRTLANMAPETRTDNEAASPPSNADAAPVLRLGTDCSGMEAPCVALRNLGVKFRHTFASDIDQNCIHTILANEAPETLYGNAHSDTPDGDITRRDHSRTPEVDLYVCGFPCQW